MATHSSTLAWKIPWMEEPGRLQCMGSRRVGHYWATSLSLSRIGERNDNPLQCSCLENPRDRWASWASVYGVAQSRTWLKRLSSSRYEKMQWEGILSWTITRRQVSGDLWLLRPSPVIAHWVSYQQKSSSGMMLGMSLPSNAGQSGYEKTPKYGTIYGHEGAVSTTNWHLPRALPVTEQGICHLPLQRLNPMPP